MLAGFSKLIYPKQPEPLYQIIPDNSYYMLSLSQAQAYFPASFLVRPAFLTLSSTVESPYQPGQPLKSLYQVTTFQKNVPFRLPISVNLSTFLPARSNDTIRLTLRYIVTRDNPFQQLAGKMKEVNLVSKISAASLEWGTAVKVSEIVATLLSYLIKEGKEDTIFELVQDINVSDLKSGYWVIYGARDTSIEPQLLEIHNAELRSDAYMEKYCYAILKVVAIPRLKDEAARERSWWELLQASKEKVLANLRKNSRQRDSSLREWESTLTHVYELARKDQSFLLKEIKQIIGRAQKEIEVGLNQNIEPEAFGSNTYPESWRDVLGVNDAIELDEQIRDYQDAVEMTDRLLKAYTDSSYTIS